MVRDRLQGPHLLDGRALEHRLVGVGEKRRPAREVAHRAPELACGDPRARVHRSRGPRSLDVRLDEVPGRGRLDWLEGRPLETDGPQDPLRDVPGVVEARARGQHLLGGAERVEQLRDRREAAAQPGVVVRLPLHPGRVREETAEGRSVRDAFDVHVEGILEPELARVAELHDRCGRERLRNRAEAVLRVRCRVVRSGRLGGADRGLPDELAVAQDRRGEARHPLLALLDADETLELGGKPLRRGHARPPASARWPARCRRRRRRGA